MKKLLLIALSAIVCSNTFAAMTVSSRSGNPVSDPLFPLKGKVYFVHYFTRNNIPTVSVSIENQNKDGVTIEFTGNELPVGTQFLSAVGKQAGVAFADKYFTVSSVYTFSGDHVTLPTA